MPPEPFARRPFLEDGNGERRWTVVVCGAGPSFTTKQARAIAIARLNDRCRVIAVNDAVFPLWGVADWLHACDFKWWQWHHEAAKFSGIKTTLHDSGGMLASWGAKWLQPSGELGYDGRVGFVRHGSNGGYQAVHAAAQAGAKKILMVGIDCRVFPSQAGSSAEHFFGQHPDGMAPPDWPRIGEKFASLCEPFAEIGVEVVNCSPVSTVTAFPKGELQGNL